MRRSFRDAVKDHCHVTGEYRGAAHRACNINYFRINPETEIIPVVFHNLKGYDAHHIMSGIAEVQSDLECIPNNMEKYVSFSLGKLRFIDSLGFLQTSLDALVGTSKPESFTIMASHEENPAGASFYYRKGTTRTSTWTLGPALRRPLSRQRRPSTASSRGKELQMRATPTRRRSGRRSNVRTLGIFTTNMSRRTCYSWPTFSRTSERHA